MLNVEACDVVLPLYIDARGRICSIRSCLHADFCDKKEEEKTFIRSPSTHTNDNRKVHTIIHSVQSLHPIGSQVALCTNVLCRQGWNGVPHGGGWCRRIGMRNRNLMYHGPLSRIGFAWGCVSVYQEHVELYVETREPERFVETSHFQPNRMTLHYNIRTVEFEHALCTYNTTLGIIQLLAAYSNPNSRQIAWVFALLGNCVGRLGVFPWMWHDLFWIILFIQLQERFHYLFTSSWL